MATPVCVHCAVAPARPLPGTFSPDVFFCSVECAARFALLAADDYGYQWCDRHEEWGFGSGCKRCKEAHREDNPRRGRK
jgi:hypothetical protein